MHLASPRNTASIFPNHTRSCPLSLSLTMTSRTRCSACFVHKHHSNASLKKFFNLNFARCTIVIEMAAESLSTTNCPSNSLDETPPQLERARQLLCARINEGVDTFERKKRVFVALDLEIYEFDYKKITEVGLSSFDTRAVDFINPGADASDWIASIRTRHLLIEEHKNCVNRVNIPGCPDKFDFGTSESTSLKYLQDSIMDTFYIWDHDATGGFRQTVLLGHDIDENIQCLNASRVSPVTFGTNVDELDTRKMVQAQPNLHKLLLALGETPSHLQNAGNRAHYTMCAFLKLVTRDSAITQADIDKMGAPPAGEQR